MLKRGFRCAVGFVIVAPFVVATKLLTPVVGAQRAVAIIGPLATALAKLSLKLSMPRIGAKEDFDRFALKMERTLMLWKPLFDVEIAERNEDLLKLRISNCPFCDVLSACGHSRLSPYVCQGDWAFAEANKERWAFHRSHQIGTGDRFCDHTYKRLPPRPVDVDP
jgi:hypothetical protein